MGGVDVRRLKMSKAISPGPPPYTKCAVICGSVADKNGWSADDMRAAGWEWYGAFCGWQGAKGWREREGGEGKIRQALIDMGWTPPPDEPAARSAVEPPGGEDVNT